MLKHQCLEQSWKDLETKLASGYPALFYGRIPYLPVYAAAGAHIQFGCLMPHGQVSLLLHGASCILVAVLLYTLNVMYVRQICGNLWRLFCHLFAIDLVQLATFLSACQPTQCIVS